MNGFMTLLRGYPLAAFFVLAFALTWSAFIPWYRSNGDGIPWFTFGPMLAAFIMAVLTEGWKGPKALLAAMVRWRVGAIWYAVAIGFPLAAQLAAMLINPLFGSSAPAWGNIPPLSQVLPMVALFAVFSGPLGEEPGWRGFATPKLLASYSALATSLIIGVIWAVWHFPLALVGDLSIYGTIHVLLAAVVLTWLYQNTRGSVLLAILMHASHQNSARYLGKVFTGRDFLQFQWIAVAIWAGAAAAILLYYGHARFAPSTSTPPETNN
jgi:uncharacterized protein